jgi:GNAT superfamily N-acetyltransferase
MMNAIAITPVRTRRDRRTLLTFPWKVYQNDPLWVPPLLPERAKIIDPQLGAFFQYGQADFFIAWRDKRPVGTICAAEDRFYNQNMRKKVCVIGFLEYIEDYNVFPALIGAAIEWARGRDLDTLLGPFNLDYEDAYGVLVRGRDRPPTLLCGHSPPYYKDFMERYGFVPARAANLAFAIDAQETPETQRLARIADGLRRRHKISVRSANLDDWQGEIDRVHYLLNNCFTWTDDPIPWSREAVESLVAPFRQIADPELALFAEVDGNVVGLFLGVPNLNEVFIHVNGLRYPWDYLRLLRYMHLKPECLAIKSVLVLPEYQKLGASVLLFDEMRRRAMAKGYTWADLSITSEDNPDTPQLALKMGAVEYKRWQVYRLPIR